MRRRGSAVLALAVVLAACGTDPTPSPKPPCPDEAPTDTSAQASLQGAELATVTVTGAVEGEFAFELYGDAAPIATANFVELARCGFYDGIAFHRILAGFVIQAGDPVTVDPNADLALVGRGGPGYRFAIESPPADVPFDVYTVAMANAAPRIPDSNGSQFFITLADLDQALRQAGTFTIFGDVVSGTDVVDAIAAVPVEDPQIGRPLERVEITSIAISEAPEE